MSSCMTVNLQEVEKRYAEFQNTHDIQGQQNDSQSSSIDLSGAYDVISSMVNQTVDLATQMYTSTSSNETTSSSATSTDTTTTTADSTNSPETSEGDETEGTGSSSSSTSYIEVESDDGMPSTEELMFMTMETGLQGHNEVVETSNGNQSADSTDNGS